MENPEVKRFGRYEIVAELGRGAMGVVYKARDPQIDRMVAVKTVSMWRQEQEEETEFRMRFLNEAQAAGRLHHAGIVSIFDVGENPENKDPYIVLEYVSGESLSRILTREKKLQPTKALQLAEEIAEALDYAHAQGVVHRDIKPGNILVTEDGHAKIADFGIAKLNLAHFTLPGRVMGTPAYMAPEQLSGEGVDGRSDLFSLGVILYAMVTGHSPFQGNSATTVCFKVANREPVAPSAFDLAVPPELDEVISRAMAKDPAQRYQTGGEFADDIRELQQVFDSGSTTTSLQTVIATGTRSAVTGTRTRRAAAGTSTRHSVAEITQARNLIRSAIHKVPLRNYVLVGTVLLLLLIAGFQSKVLVISPRLALSAPGSATPTTAAGSSVEPIQLTSAQPSSDLLTPRSTATSAHSRRKAHKSQVAVSPASRSARPFSARETTTPVCNLDLAVQHQFRDATLFVWVDEQLALTRTLHGGVQKHMVVFNGLRGVDSETLKIPAGKHSLRVRALSSDETTDLSKTISGDFMGGTERSLRVTFEKHNTIMRLTWQ
ncbi:MAG TPA: serine/threonine-protein kinase [Candidatus Sulfotelmatobacter sp.]|jgi:serine/threonine-protein kinase|nr:serine/threonine-protein kinase [Candidatus Sulfotelmatobacter sp.]